MKFFKIKLHKANIFLLTATIVLLIINISKSISYAPWDRINYAAGISSAEGLPVNCNSQIITRKGEKIHLWFGNIEQQYWGYSNESPKINYISAPDLLEINYYSLREKKTYKGTFKLPANIIDSLYQLNFKYKKRFSRYGKGDSFGYEFIVGIGPSGEVTVWMEGRSYLLKKEIARFTCKEIDNWYGLTGNKLENKYNSFILHSETDSLIKNNIPYDTISWKRKNKKHLYYIWSDSSYIKNVNVSYFNTEKEIYDFTKNYKFLVKKTMPSFLAFNKLRACKYEYKFNFENSIGYLDSIFALHSHKDTLAFFFYFTPETKIEQLHVNLININKIDSFRKNIINK